MTSRQVKNQLIADRKVSETFWAMKSAEAAYREAKHRKEVMFGEIETYCLVCADHYINGGDMDVSNCSSCQNGDNSTKTIPLVGRDSVLGEGVNIY